MSRAGGSSAPRPARMIDVRLCDGSLHGGTLWAVGDTEQVECPVCGSLLKPGWGYLVPSHEPPQAAVSHGAPVDSRFGG